MENDQSNFMTYNGNHIFHYTRFDSALKIISSRKLIFGDFKKMNDIAESRKEILGDHKAYEELNKYKAISLTCDELDHRGFEIDSLWGHYADKGNGACLVFDKLKLLAAFDSMKCLHWHDKINYVDGSNKALFFMTEEEIGIEKEIEENIKDIFFVKSKDWCKENEYRLLIRSHNEKDKYLCYGDALIAVVICMPLCDKIKDTCEYDILRHLTDIPILHYHTSFGNKTLTRIGDKEGDEKLWPILGVDYDLSV